METITEQTNASQVFCPNLECMARGQIGQGNIVSHGRKPPRYRYKTCGKTFSAKEATLFAGLRKPMEVIVMVVTLLAYGCPIQATVHAFGLQAYTHQYKMLIVRLFERGDFLPCSWGGEGALLGSIVLVCSIWLYEIPMRGTEPR